MGAFYLSAHFKSNDASPIVAAAKNAVPAAGGKAYIAKPVAGWINLYPSQELLDPETVRQVASESGVRHVVVFMVHDSDVLMYWYIRDGALADYFNSAPDYFGEASDEDMQAKGNPAAFADLLDAASQRTLASIVSTRMIGGEAPDDMPPLAEDSLDNLARLFGITGVMGCYEYLEDGESIEGAGTAEEMIAIG